MSALGSGRLGAQYRHTICHCSTDIALATCRVGTNKLSLSPHVSVHTKIPLRLSLSCLSTSSAIGSSPHLTQPGFCVTPKPPPQGSSRHCHLGRSPRGAYPNHPSRSDLPCILRLRAPCPTRLGPCARFPLKKIGPSRVIQGLNNAADNVQSPVA
ncbi:hypothetical protein GQ53DRAFT_221523 [Thozetella sp. PMI_491]|nr:hypothetical protein GQ53DRAFT_221523 [Thozetella sp. PMI_491]